MKKFKYFICLWAVLWFLVGLPMLTFAAPDPGQLTIDNKLVEDIGISITEGESYVTSITPKNNSYAIKVVDETNTDLCGNSTYAGKAATLTFKNNFSGWIKLTYTTSGAQGANGSNGSISVNTDGCEAGTTSDGKNTIKVPAGGSFSISVTSSDNSKAEKQSSYTGTFKPTAIQREEFTPLISFKAPTAHGTFTVTGTKSEGTVNEAVSVPGSGEYASYTLTAQPDTGYQVFRWVFTSTDGTIKYFDYGSKDGLHTATKNGTGEITCEFMRTGSAMYEVNGARYAYFDQALTAAGDSGQINLASSGTMYGSTGQTSFTIPSGVKFVLPYSASDTSVKDTSLTSTTYFPYGNYTKVCVNNTYASQPTARDTSRTYFLTIPNGTTVDNKGIIAVGGTLHGNAALSGAHSNLQIEKNAVLNLKSGSVLSAIGYVYGEGSVLAEESGAMIFQPLSSLRMGSSSWQAGAAGTSIGSGMGMSTSPDDGYKGTNPSPRYSTQAIQCTLVMKYGNTMYGYAEQHSYSACNMGTVVLVGTASNTSHQIGLKEGATLTSTYDASKKSSTFGNVGKLTLTIDGGGKQPDGSMGGAEQGSMSLTLKGVNVSLTNWPFPVPYNYDLVLKNGEYKLNYDLSLLPGAGMKIESDAKLIVPKGVSLAVFTGANDQTSYGRGQSNALVLTYNTNKDATAAYPTNGSLQNFYAPDDTNTKSTMANLVVNGKLDVQNEAYLGGIVQTTGSGTVIMNGITTNKTNKDYVFTRQLGLTGKAWDGSSTLQFACATIYKFYPQYFDAATGKLTQMESGKTYCAVNDVQNSITSFTLDYYNNSQDFTSVSTKTETVTATAVGQWCSHSNIEEIPAVDPTCTEDGSTAGTKCSDCGMVLTPQETDPATGHNYVDGVCTKCGDMQTVLIENFMTQIVLGNVLDMRIAFNMGEHDLEGAYAVATKEYADGRENVPITVSSDKWVEVKIGENTYYYFTFDDISAKEMADNINVTIYNADGAPISNNYVESIQSYVMRILENQNDRTKTMLVDMLNYGAAAQAFFEYGNYTDPEYLPTSSLSDAQKAYATPTLAACTDNRVEGTNYLGTRLELKNNIGMHVAFTGLTEEMYAVVTHTDHHGNKVESTIKPTDLNGETFFDIDQIIVADGRQLVTVVVYTANGTEYGRVSDSIESYVNRQSFSESDLYAMIMKFSDSTWAYLHPGETRPAQ